MMPGQQPIIILKEGTKRETGKSARFNNIMAARAISDAVKSTLGPKKPMRNNVALTGNSKLTTPGEN